MIKFFETDFYSLVIHEELERYKLFGHFLGRKHVNVPRNVRYCFRCIKETIHLTYHKANGVLLGQCIKCKTIVVLKNGEV